jgi:UDP-glucose 4-epimerase
MSVLVTGGAGYVGSQMAWEFFDRGEECIVIDDLSTGVEWAVPTASRLVVGNVANRGLLRELVRMYKIDAIIHFAGTTGAAESVMDPLRYYANNTENTRELIHAAIDAGIDKFIYSSSALVYGSPLTIGPIREDALLNPATPYGSSKLMSEIMLRDAAEAHGIRYVILRYFNAAGADPKGRTGKSSSDSTHLIKVACEAALGRRRHLQLYGDDHETPDGTCIRDYVHVSDVAAAHFAALNYLRKGGRNFTANCGSGQGCSARQVIETVERLSGAKLEVVTARRRKDDPPVLVTNTHRISRLDWKPKFSDLNTMVTTTLDWEWTLQDRRQIA